MFSFQGDGRTLILHAVEPLPIESKLHTELPLPSKIKQVDGLQVLRAVAVLLVCWEHTNQHLFRLDGWNLPTINAFGVDIFFVISGFILSLVVLRSRRPAGARASWEFFKRRLIRIYPIYWIFCLVGAAQYLHRMHHLDLAQVWPIALLLPLVKYPRQFFLVDYSWTLVFEMSFYFLLAVIQLVTVKRAMAVLIALQCVMVGMRLLFSIKRPVLIIACNPMLLEFIYGALIAMAFDAFGRRRKLGIALAVVGAGAAIGMSAFNVVSPPAQWIMEDQSVLFRVVTWGIAGACLVGGVVFWLPETTGRISKTMVV
ncbi:MAG: acyltransferase, partial [Terriglobus sp.]